GKELVAVTVTKIPGSGNRNGSPDLLRLSACNQQVTLGVERPVERVLAVSGSYGVEHVEEEALAKQQGPPHRHAVGDVLNQRLGDPEAPGLTEGEQATFTRVLRLAVDGERVVGEGGAVPAQLGDVVPTGSGVGQPMNAG